MSFRELRTFTETMRALGYTRLISVESFRTPNFELVADVLYWLVKRYEPSADIAYEIDRESDRVNFIRSVSELVLQKGRLNLNMKKLYQADGYAVQELLKLANVLKAGMKLRGEEAADHTQLLTQANQRGAQESKATRQLCGDLTNEGSTIFFLLEHEVSIRNTRNKVIARATELTDLERRLRQLLSGVTEQVESTQQSLANLHADETSLEQKIENKKAHLERSQKRLKSLMAVRPTFMEEYERYESELHQQFVVYLEQYRNLEYLEHQLSKFNRLEDELLAEQETKLRLMRERLRKEELKVLRGEALPEGLSAEDQREGDLSADAAAIAAAQKAAATNAARNDDSRGNGFKRPRAASGRQRPNPVPDAAAASPGSDANASYGRVQGNMYGGGHDSSEEEEGEEEESDISVSSGEETEDLDLEETEEEDLSLDEEEEEESD